MEKQRRVRIYHIESLDYSSPIKHLFQVVQTRSELSLGCVLGIAGERERQRERRERNQDMTEIPHLNKTLD